MKRKLTVIQCILDVYNNNNNVYRRNNKNLLYRYAYLHLVLLMCVAEWNKIIKNVNTYYCSAKV